MEQERNIIGAALSVALSSMIDFLAPLKWFALLGLVLIVADLRFGVRAAKARGKKFKIDIFKLFKKKIDIIEIKEEEKS
jgi:hypothetical protein